MAVASEAKILHAKWVIMIGIEYSMQAKESIRDSLTSCKSLAFLLECELSKQVDKPTKNVCTIVAFAFRSLSNPFPYDQRAK